MPVRIFRPRLRAADDRDARSAAAEVLLALGGDPNRLEPPRGSTNAVFLCAEPAVALSVAPVTANDPHRAARLEAARVLARHDLFVPLVEGVPQPVPVSNGRTVTVWQRMPVSIQPVGWRDVGGLLRRLADVPAAEAAGLSGRLPDLDDLSDVRVAIADLADAELVAAADARVLAELADRLQQELTDGPGRPRVLAHGDLWLPNILAGPGGLRLCDADELGLAPFDWDLAALLAWRRPSSEGPARRQLLDGWGAAEPAAGRLRTLDRAAHLRRSVRLLAEAPADVRNRYWNAVRLGTWRRLYRRWDDEGFPELHQERREQAANLLRGLAPRMLDRRRRPA